MEQYISKSALVAEINQRIEDYKSYKIDDSYHDGLIFALEDLKDDFINTLEVKDMELEKEIDLVEDKYQGFYSLSRADIIDIAKHFYEFGLKVVQKGEEA
jgi:hypothetical protein